MADNKHYVKLNNQAQIFYDPVSKLKILKGKVVELDEKLYNRRFIQAALENGYLKTATAEEFRKFSEAEVKEEKENTPVENAETTEEANTDEVSSQEDAEDPEEDASETSVNTDAEDKVTKFNKLHEAGKTPEEVKGQFSMADLKVIAAVYDIEAEEGDTKLDLVKAIYEELESNN